MDLSLKICITAGLVFFVTYAGIHILDATGIRATVQRVAVILTILYGSALVAVLSLIGWIWL